jgi:hypothetical protein
MMFEDEKLPGVAVVSGPGSGGQSARHAANLLLAFAQHNALFFLEPMRSQ